MYGRARRVAVHLSRSPRKNPDDPAPEPDAAGAVGEQPEAGELPAAVLGVVGEQAPRGTPAGAAREDELTRLVLGHHPPWCPTRVAEDAVRSRWGSRVRRGRPTPSRTALGSASPAAVTTDRC